MAGIIQQLGIAGLSSGWNNTAAGYSRVVWWLKKYSRWIWQGCLVAEKIQQVDMAGLSGG